MNKKVSIVLLSTLFGAQALIAAPGVKAPKVEAPAASWAESHPATTGVIVGAAEAATLAGSAYGLTKAWQNRQAIIDWTKEHPYKAAGYTAGAVATAALTAYAWHNWLPVAVVNTFVKVGTIAAYDGILSGLKWGWSKTPWARERIEDGALNQVGRNMTNGAAAAAGILPVVAKNAASGAELSDVPAAPTPAAAAAPEAADETPKASNLTSEEATKLAHYRREGRATLGKGAQAAMDRLIAKEAGK